MASTPRGSLLSRCGPFESLFSGGSWQLARDRVARDATLHRTRRPTHMWVPGKWVAHPARGSPASCRGAMASTPRGSLLSRCGPFESLFSGGSWQLARDRVARDATLHRTRRPTHMWVAGKWVARPARGSPASCRGAMASTSRGSLLSRCSPFESLFSGGSWQLARDRVARDATLHSGSRILREAPRHPAGERWHQRHADRSSRDVVRSSLSSREDRGNSPGTGWRGTPPCIGRDVQPTGPPCIGRDVQPTSGLRESGSRVSREAPRHPAGERWPQRHADRSSRDVVCSCLSSREDRGNSPGTGWRGTPPCIGRDVQPTGPPCIGRDVQPTSGLRESGSRVPREAPRHPAGERWHQRHADRSSRDVVRSSLSSREDRRNSPGTGWRGTPPCIGRDVQPTGHRAGGHQTHQTTVSQRRL